MKKFSSDFQGDGRKSIAEFKFLGVGEVDDKLGIAIGHHFLHFSVDAKLWIQVLFGVLLCG